jgi:hypothetical protein
MRRFHDLLDRTFFHHRTADLTCWFPFTSCFLHNPKPLQADYPACLLLSRWFLARLILRPCRWRRHFPPKSRLAFNGLHGVLSQKIEIFIIMIFFSSDKPLRDVTPITGAVRSKAWTVFTHSNTGILGSNPTRGMDVYVRLFCLCCPVCR